MAANAAKSGIREMMTMRAALTPEDADFDEFMASYGLTTKTSKIIKELA
jgi:hypothetical protein